jgi:roadblock/LC7 domain-containing protein
VSEIEELVKKRGVLIAGRFAPDFQVAEQKTAGLFVETPKVVEYVGRLCATAHMMFSTLAFAADGLAPTSWQPLNAWACSGGPYTIAMVGDRFVVAQTEYVESFDELIDLLRQGATGPEQ